MGFNYPATLCWDCRRACGGCSWVDESIPVPGWDADLKPIRADHMKNALMVESYFVRRCPEFVPDGAERRKKGRP